MCFLQTLCLYAVVTIYFFVTMLFARAPSVRAGPYSTLPDSIVSQLDLAHTRLTSPLPLVAELFHPESASLRADLSKMKGPMDMFIELRKTSRLVIGLGEGRYPPYGMHRWFDRDREEVKLS